MTVRTVGALLCGGLLILATSAGAYEPDKKDSKAGAATNISHSNVKSPPACKKAGGVWNKAKKSCAARP